MVSLALMTAEAPTGLAQRLAESIPVGRVGTSEDAEAAVVFVASEEVGWMTGVTADAFTL